MKLNIHIQLQNNKHIELQVDSFTTIKQVISEVSTEETVLFHKDIYLENEDKTLSFYNIKDESILLSKNKYISITIQQKLIKVSPYTDTIKDVYKLISNDGHDNKCSPIVYNGLIQQQDNDILLYEIGIQNDVIIHNENNNFITITKTKKKNNKIVMIKL
jgi:hypothetical protein